MPGRPVALLGHMHVCPQIDPGPKPHVGGPIVSVAQDFVTVDGIPVSTVDSKTLCTGMPGTAAIIQGSSIANIEGKRVARIGDSCEHGGKLVQGIPWITFE